MKFALWSLCALCISLPSISAEATFSSDGKRVFLLGWNAAKLPTIDLTTQTTSQLDLSSFTGGAGILALSLSEKGALLFVTAQNAYAYDFEKKSCEKLCSAEAGWKFEDLACDPKTGGILFAIRKAKRATSKTARGCI